MKYTLHIKHAVSCLLTDGPGSWAVFREICTTAERRNNESLLESMY